MLMALLGGKPKGDSGEGSADDPDMESDKAEDGFIDDFASAMKDDDAEGMRAAFKAAVRACMKGYSSDKGESEEMD
jgi:hypothetical protein